MVGSLNAGFFVWGSNPYTADSHVATAAVHAGVLRPGESGVVFVTILPGQQLYPGSIKNGVNSRPWNSFGLSYRIQAEPTPQVAVETRPMMEKPEPVKKVFKSGETITNSIGMELIGIPAGTFTMGDGAGVAVTLTQGFSLGKTEVSWGEWQQVMGKVFQGQKYNVASKDFPASEITWDEAIEFCKKLTATEHKNGKLPAGESYRLPTDAEWEYACRAGTTTAFSFGDDESKLGEYAWFDGNAKNIGEQYAHKVGLKKPNPWGLYDMHGNVWEWCSDCYDGKLAGGIDPVGPERGSGRVFRGGGWGNDPGRCRSASRGNYVPSDRGNGLGFRVARSQSAQ